MPFFELEFPRDIAFQAQGGPEFSTKINEGFSGFEQRNRNWAYARGKWTIALDHKPISYFQQVRNFWLAVGGRADAFRFYDPLDGQACGQPCAQVSSTVYQLQNIYPAGSRTYTRTIVKPITSAVQRFDGSCGSNTVNVYVAGVRQSSGWMVDATTGLITFSVSPGSAAVTADFQFDYPVRFDSDWTAATLEESDVLGGNAMVSWPGLQLIEVRLISGAGSLGS